MNRQWVVLAIIITSMFLTGCVSDSEYEALEKRVTYLEGRLGVSSNQEIPVNNEIDDSGEDDGWKATEVTDGVPDSSEYDEFTVVLTPENINTYISLDSYNDGSRHCYRHRSNIYDKGWVFAEQSSDFYLSYGEADYDNIQFKRAFDVYWGNELSDIKLFKCNGKLKFINIKDVTSYNTDDMKYIRDVEFSNGQRTRYVLDAETYSSKW